MLDRYTVPAIRWPLSKLAHVLDSINITANQVTLFGFVLGRVDLCCTNFTQQYIGSHIKANASDTILA